MSAAEKLNPAVQIKLRVLKGPHEGQSFHLSKSSFTLGRGPENEVVLINDPQISRQHARLQVVGHDIEIVNLSQKNKVLVGSEVVQKWKLVNESTFVIGDTEIQIIYDLGKPVSSSVSAVPVPVAPPLGDVLSPPPPPAAPSVLVPTKPKQQVAKRPMPPAGARNGVPGGPRSQMPSQRQQAMGRPQQQQRPIPQQQQQQQFNAPPLTAAPAPAAQGVNPKVRFYAIVGVLVLGLVYWLNMEEPKKAGPKQEIKSTLRYEDEYLIKQNSVAEKDLEQKRKAKQEQKNSSQSLRIEENFQKGMRDFYLGNYPRAQDFFQVVLSFDANHTMARRHMYLAKIRQDEIIKAKLALGESYYQKHNFKMCQAQYQQILIMLEGKNNDQSYQIAQSMSEKCGLAAEGIR